MDRERIKKVIKNLNLSKHVLEIILEKLDENNCFLFDNVGVTAYPQVSEKKNSDGKNSFDLLRGTISFEHTLGGGFFTCIPISSEEYRKEHPTSANWEIRIEEEEFVLVAITSDHGRPHYVMLLDEEARKPVVLESLEKIKAMK